MENESKTTFSPPQLQAPYIQVVVKISKLCNLRCNYCYEFNELGKKTRMSVENIRKLFSNINAAITGRKISGAEFVWHGGEPFLIPFSYYSDIGALQRGIFENEEYYRNVVQTNLTVLNDKQLLFLKERKFFDGIGVSFDVFGDQRVDKNGVLRDLIVMQNLQKLVDNDIRFGAISVLCRDTYPYSRHIQKFWHELNVGFRFLPFHLSLDDQRSARHGLHGREQVAAFKQCFLDWLSSKNAIRVDPLHEYIGYALDYMADGSKQIYDPDEGESVFVVNTNGDVCGVGQGELYSPEYCYGNIFDTSFMQLLESENRKRAISNSLSMMHKYCKNCRFFGHCPGHAVADATAEDAVILEENGCTIRHVLEYIVDTLYSADIYDELLCRANELKLTASPTAAPL